MERRDEINNRLDNANQKIIDAIERLTDSDRLNRIEN